MLKKLKSVSKNLALQSLSKSFFGATIFVLSLLWIWERGNYSFLPLAAYFGSAFYFYIYPVFEKRFLCSFLIILLIPFFFINSPLFLIYSLFTGILFFLLLGIKNLAFINRYQIYQLLNNFLFFLIFIAFFSADKSQLFFPKYLILFTLSFFLFKELLNWNFSRFESLMEIPAKKINVYSIFFSFLLGQFFWAIALLPIGFLNSAVLALVFILAAKDIIINYLEGKIDKNLVLKNITMVVIFSIIIFAVSKWKI